jgi:xylulokinase
MARYDRPDRPKLSLLGVDLGTTTIKAALYDDHGVLLGESSAEYALITHSPTVIEQDPDDWWRLARQVICGALASGGRDGRTVRGVAVSSQGISFVLADHEGHPLHNAINWLDRRAGAECAEILEQLPAERLFHLTGKRAAPFYLLPKLLWVRRHRPDLWRQASRLMMGHDYLVYRLCGAHVTDHSMAGGTLLYDLRQLSWSKELFDAFDLPGELLPALAWSGAQAGTLLPSVAEELGLRPGTTVSVGGQDQKCAALGAGIEDGVATVSLGTSSAIEQIMMEPSTDPLMRVPSFTFVQPGRWVLEGVVGTAGISLRWLRDLLSASDYAELDAAAITVPAGSEGVCFYPHLSGATSPHWNTGGRGAFHGLSLATTRGHLARAVMEGIAYQVAANLEVTQELAGPVKQVIVFGGGARSSLWRTMLGEVLNRPIAWASTAEAACLGGAMLAGVGSVLFPSLDEARRGMLPALSVRAPDPAGVAAYAKAYAAYRRLEGRFLE